MQCFSWLDGHWGIVEADVYPTVDYEDKIELSITFDADRENATAYKRLIEAFHTFGFETQEMFVVANGETLTLDFHGDTDPTFQQVQDFLINLGIHQHSSTYNSDEEKVLRLDVKAIEGILFLKVYPNKAPQIIITLDTNKQSDPIYKQLMDSLYRYGFQEKKWLLDFHQNRLN